MSKSIRTAKEAAIKLADMLLEVWRDDYRNGITVSFLELYGHLTRETKKAVARYFIEKFIVWSKGVDRVTRVVLAPGVNVFVELARNVNDEEILNSLAEELSRIGWHSVEELTPHLGRPLSKKEISLLCDHCCNNGKCTFTDPEKFYDLAIRSGHGHVFATEIDMRIKKCMVELFLHAD